MPPFTVHGEAILEGIKVPHDEDEWWVVFPAHGGRGLSMEELLTAYWDGKVLSWDMQLDGTEYNTFG